MCRFDTSVAKGLKLKVKKFRGQITTFVKVTWEKLVVGFFALSIMYRVNNVNSLLVLVFTFLISSFSNILYHWVYFVSFLTIYLFYCITGNARF